MRLGPMKNSALHAPHVTIPHVSCAGASPLPGKWVNLFVTRLVAHGFCLYIQRSLGALVVDSFEVVGLLLSDSQELFAHSTKLRVKF